MALLYASRSPRKATTELAVRPLGHTEHLAFVQAADKDSAGKGDTDRGGAGGDRGGGGGAGSGVSFLQCPSWGVVKAGWEAQSVGWYRGAALVGAGLVLLRWLPRVNRCLAYLPEGPMIDWFGEETDSALEDWLDPLVVQLRRRGAFAVKLGPKVISRTWSAGTLKQAMADGEGRRLGDVPADYVDPRADALSRRLQELGWRRAKRGGDGTGFTDFQPRYLYRLPLAGRDEEQILAAFNQQWRRNIRLAQRAGVHVACVGRGWLPEFHRLYVETAARDRFTPRPLEYFQRMFDAFDEEDPERIRLYIARHGDEALAAATMVRVGSYAWYSYGASADRGREYRPSNALQWRMIQDCVSDGMRVYDLRGVSDTLDPEHHLYGLLRFKSGLGGEAVEYVGEWDYPINGALYRAFNLYLARR